MEISKIEIGNFLGLESLTMGLRAPINIIAGPNEAGKSSIRDAIQWCLTGQARGLKTHGEQSALIHNGGKAAEVTITLSDGKVMNRRKTPKSSSTASGTEDLFPNIWPGILCDPLVFLDWPDSARRELLFKLIPGLKPTKAGVAFRIVEWLKQAGVEVTPEVQDKSQSLMEIVVSKNFASAEVEAVTRRRIAKRLRDEAKVEEPEIKAAIGDSVYILPDIKQAEVQAGIDSLRLERDKLLQKRGKIEAQTDKLPELEAELAALTSNPAEAPPEGEIEELEKLLSINLPILKDLQTKVNSLESGCPAKLFPAVCPSFTSKPPCSAAGQIAIPAVEPSDPASAAKLRAELKEKQEEITLLEKRFQEARDRKSAHDQYALKRQALADQIAKLKKQAEQAMDRADLDQQIETLNVRMKTGWELLEAVRDFWRKQDAAEKATGVIAETENEIAVFDALAKALAPDGIPSQMIAEALGPVNDLLAVASNYLFPGRSLILTKGLGIELSGSPFSTLSKSAKFRVGVAFQYALAKLAGARLLLIDEADILDPSNRANIIGFLLEIKNDFDTILLFATSNQAAPSSNQDIQVWWIEAGKLTPLIEDKAA